MNNKKLLLQVLFSLFVLNAIGQEEPSSAEPDTSEINFKKTKILIIDKFPEETASSDTLDGDDDDEEDDKYKHWSGMYVGFNSLINDKNSIAHPAGFPLLQMNHSASINIQLNFFEKQFELGSPHVKFITGFGIISNNIAFEKSSDLIPGLDTVALVNSGINYNRNRLSTSGFTIPLLFGFNTHKGEKGVHLTLGAVGSVNAWVRKDQKYFHNGEKHVVQTNNDFNVNRWNVSAIANIGFGDWVTLYAQYQLTPYFEKNAANPTLNLATIGLRTFPF